MTEMKNKIQVMPSSGLEGGSVVGPRGKPGERCEYNPLVGFTCLLAVGKMKCDDVSFDDDYVNVDNDGDYADDDNVDNDNGCGWVLLREVSANWWSIGSKGKRDKGGLADD